MNMIVPDNATHFRCPSTCLRPQWDFEKGIIQHFVACSGTLKCRACRGDAGTCDGTSMETNEILSVSPAADIFGTPEDLLGRSLLGDSRRPKQAS